MEVFSSLIPEVYFYSFILSLFLSLRLQVFPSSVFPHPDVVGAGAARGTPGCHGTVAGRVV